MKKRRWSNYDKFMVIADKSNGKITSNYTVFFEFKRVIAAIQKIADTKSSTFSFEGKDYTKPVTSDQARGILDKVNRAEFHKGLFTVAARVLIDLKNY